MLVGGCVCVCVCGGGGGRRGVLCHVCASTYHIQCTACIYTGLNVPMASPVSFASPVIILTSTPPPSSSETALSTPSRGGSHIPIIPTNDSWFRSHPLAMATTEWVDGETCSCILQQSRNGKYSVCAHVVSRRSSLAN